jgi:hypothetical protein
MFLASGLTLRTVQAEELRRVLPPDRQQLDPGLASLVMQLRKIVAARDDARLLAMMDPKFRVEFDQGYGPAAFRRYWNPKSADSRVWGVLEHLLRTPPHAYSETLSAMPYVFARFPFDLDPLHHVVAIRSAVRLFARPEPNASQVASIDYSIIPLTKPSEPPVVIPSGSYLEVQHPVAGRCFAASADICHPAAHRIFFERIGGRWRWISLAAGTLEDPPELKHKPAAG